MIHLPRRDRHVNVWLAEPSKGEGAYSSVLQPLQGCLSIRYKPRVAPGAILLDPFRVQPLPGPGSQSLSDFLPDRIRCTSGIAYSIAKGWILRSCHSLQGTVGFLTHQIIPCWRPRFALLEPFQVLDLIRFRILV